MQADPDAAVRAAAFAELESLVLEHGPRLAWRLIDREFMVSGEKFRFAGRAVGIFKPKRMSAALSIRTVAPRAGRRTWYRDQVGQPDYQTGLLAYDLARGGREDYTNRALHEARRRQAPLVYFVGVGEATYEPIWPVGAHILPDAEGGPAVVTNGICMSTLHHTAFDANLPDRVRDHPDRDFLDWRFQRFLEVTD